MKFAREEYSMALIEEMWPLWRKHYADTADEMYGDLDPDLSVYERCDRSGALRIFTARQSGSLAGYQIFFVGPHPHHKGSIQAEQDILYVSPEARRGLNGMRFVRWCADELRREGVSILHQHIGSKNDAGLMFERMGYVLEDLTYSMRL